MKPSHNPLRSLAALGALLGTAALMAPASTFAASTVTLSNLPTAVTTLTTASINWTLSGTGTVYCRRDTYAPAPCPKPFALGTSTPLALGAHRVDFYVNTGSGINAAAPAASYSWQIITTPTVTLSNLPTNPTTQTTASINWTLNGTGTVYCRRDGFTPAVCPKPFQVGTTTPLATGAHTVQFFVDYGNGINTAAPSASYTWQVNAVQVPALASATYPTALIASGASSNTWDGSSTVYDSSGNLLLSHLSDPKGSGNAVNLHRVTRSGSMIWGGVRAENAWPSTGLVPGNDYWMSFAVMMKSDEAIPSSTADDSMVVFQTHTPAQGATQPDIALFWRGQTKTMFWRVAYNTYPSNTWNYVGGPNPDYQGVTTVQTEAMPAAGVWTRFIVHYRPGYATSHNPLVEIWRATPGTDYTKIVSYTGFNTYNSLSGPSYPRIGLYKWSSSTWNSNSLGFYLTPLHFGQGANLYDSAKAALSGF